MLSKNEKSLVMASVQGSLGYPLVAKQVRQISQLRGGGHRADIFNISSDAGGIDGEDLLYEARVAFRRAARGRTDQPRGMRFRPRGKGGKPDETCERNRRYGCGSEFH